MADKTIGDLTQAVSIGGEDLFVLQQNGEAKKLKGSQLVRYAQDAVGEQVTAAESAKTESQAARDAILNMIVEAITLDQGAPASVEKSLVDSVYKLTFGLPKGEKGAKGDTGAQGEVGPQGETGATGATGATGPAGPANTLTIGTVTSGIEASATITGEAPNQVLNLVLKQGDKGDKGATGETGATGPQGPQGPQGEQGIQGEQGEAAPTITGITIRQSDYHMIVTLSDGTSYDAGYCRGASGAGTGDMLASTYDPQGKAQDIFAYADAKSNKSVAFTVTLSASGWSGNEQTASDARFLTGDYAYSVAPDSGSFAAYGKAVIYADNVTTAGKMQFHCGEVPTVDLTVNILRIEVSA